MQNNASSHVAKYTKQILHKADVFVIFWPVFSSDLNSIKSLTHYEIFWRIELQTII